MSAPGTAGTLARIGTSALYAPPGGEAWAFLLWDAGAAQPSLPLADTWADRGTPPSPGWYVFLRALPDTAHAAELEAALRKALAPPGPPEPITLPAATGWAWSAYVPGAAAADLRAAVAVELDVEQCPVVAADAPVALPRNVVSFTFAKGLRVQAAGGAGAMDGLIVTQPLPAGQPWTGIRIPLAGALAGCIRFPALLDSPVAGNRSVKEAADVRLDPLRPFDPERTRTTPTGTEYLLVAEGEGRYRLERHRSA